MLQMPRKLPHNQHKKEALAVQGRDRRTGGPFCGRYMPMRMGFLRNILLASLVLTFSASVSAKRSAPEPVHDVFHNGTRYSVVHFAELNGTVINGGYIEAHDESTSNKIWSVVVYTTHYREELERDVQDIFIKTMVIDATGKHLVVTNENNEVYIIVLATQEVHHVEMGI